MNNLSNNEYQYVEKYIKFTKELSCMSVYGAIFFINLFKEFLIKIINEEDILTSDNIKELNNYINNHKQYQEKFVNDQIISIYNRKDRISTRKHNYKILLNSISNVKLEKENIDNPLFYGAKIKIEKEE